MSAFNILYIILSIFGAVLVLGTFFLITIDIIKYSILEVVQYIVVFINPNVFNKDTLDFSVLQYYKNGEKDEPYSIYLQQEFIAQMFKLVYFFMMVVGLQIFVYMVMYFLKYLKGGEFNETLNLDSAKKSIGVMVIVIACAFIQNTYYNTSFTQALQPNLKDSITDIREMRNIIYDNMSYNSDFLQAVVTEDIDTCVKIINQQGGKTDAIAMMIYTLSLYNFYKINVSENDPNFSKIRDMFTLAERKIRGINPIDYMYFSQNVFIPNLYPIISARISGPGNVLDTKAKQDMVRKKVNNRIMAVNLKLLALFQVPNKRSSFRNYIYFSWILTFAFAVAIGSIYKEELTLIYNNFIIPFWVGLKVFFWNIVMPFDFSSSEEENKGSKE